MTRHIRFALLGVLLSTSAPRAAMAGMPSFTLADLNRSFTRMLTDPTRFRLEAISFFLVVLLLCAGVVKLIWNSLRKEFAWLPRLSYGKALGVIVLWGLLFVLVLTMISGARELMTPGAWEKTGLTYRVADDSLAIERQITARYRAVERLQEALIAYAEKHGKRYPSVSAFSEIPEQLRRMPDAFHQRYLYVGGRLPDEDSFGEGSPLFYEAGTFGPDRLVAMTDGEILWMPVSELERAVKREQP